MAYMSEDQAKMMRFMPWVLCPLTFLVTMNMAGSVQLFLAATAVLQYIQTTLWHNPIIRSSIGLPPLEEVVGNPTPMKPLNSPFSNMASGVHYEPPRTITTTATETDQQRKKVDTNPFDYFKNIKKSIDAAKSGAGGYLDKYKAKTAAQNEKKSAADFEQRRIQEEKEKYWARRESQQFKRQQKKQERK